MTAFAWLAAVAGWVVVPVVSAYYLRFRVEGRREQLVNLFTLPGILAQYLRARGQEIEPQPGEPPEAYQGRLRDIFAGIFEREFGREYGQAYYAASVLVGSLASALVVYVLVREGLGPPLVPGIPDAVKFALLGSFFWTVWSLARGYGATDLVPTTFIWMVVRYVLAVAIGLLAGLVFAEAYAGLGAFVLSSVPVQETMRFLRARLARVAPGVTFHEGHPALEKLQGMERPTIDKLETLGISTTQELAYADPLDLLFKINVPPKVLMDWMDQALLYNYLGESTTQLRVRGIRGAIELAALRDGLEAPQDTPQLVASMAQALGVSHVELRNLVENIYFDNQVQLVWKIWGEV